MHHIDNPGSEGRLKREFFWGRKKQKKRSKKKERVTEFSIEECR
jgi:hypothetical protein